jgi:hypothetical protein
MPSTRTIRSNNNTMTAPMGDSLAVVDGTKGRTEFVAAVLEHVYPGKATISRIK